jgi:hypothetical protein
MTDESTAIVEWMIKVWKNSEENFPFVHHRSHTNYSGVEPGSLWWETGDRSLSTNIRDVFVLEEHFFFQFAWVKRKVHWYSEKNIDIISIPAIRRVFKVKSPKLNNIILSIIFHRFHMTTGFNRYKGITEQMTCEVQQWCTSQTFRLEFFQFI